MPTCQNCGHHVSTTTLRVSYPEGVTDPERCQHCSIRDGVDWRAPRTKPHDTHPNASEVGDRELGTAHPWETPGDDDE